MACDQSCIALILSLQRERDRQTDIIEKTNALLLPPLLLLLLLLLLTGAHGHTDTRAPRVTSEPIGSRHIRARSPRHIRAPFLRQHNAK